MNLLKINHFVSISAVMLALTFASCKKDDLVNVEDNSNSQTSLSTGNTTVSGAKLENPYALATFKEAYANLKSRSRISEEVNIVATHYYVRFLPKDGIEYEKLKKLDLVLFDYPMDYKIESYGAYYHDPSIPDSLYTWQYCVVKVGFEFPNIQYEKLEDLYLFDNDVAVSNARTSIDVENYELLEQETFKITNNELEPNIKNGRVNASCDGKWKPEATLKVYDDYMKTLVPIVGVKVRFNRWFESYEKPTDAQGVARCLASFRRQVNFMVVWETEQDWFDLRQGNYGQASLKFADQCGNASYNFYDNSFYWAYATVFNAAWYYYTNNGNFGIKQPPSSRGLLKQRLHIGVHDFDASNLVAPDSDFDNFSKLIFSAQVDVYARYKLSKEEPGYVYYDSRPLTFNTINPIALATLSEIYNNRSSFVRTFGTDDGGKMMINSWGEAVALYLTNDKYKPTSFIHRQNIEKIAVRTYNNKYPHRGPLFEDLIDDFNQRFESDFYCPQYFERVIDKSYSGLDCYECKYNVLPPQNTTAFVYPNENGSFYHTTLSGTDPCPGPGTSDNYNCWVSKIPNDTKGYVKKNSFYVEPISDKKETPYDRVVGYKLSELENLFYDQPKSMADLKKLIKDKLDNPTEVYIDEYFANYNY